jgi:hypothetical protein
LYQIKIINSPSLQNPLGLTNLSTERQQHWKLHFVPRLKFLPLNILGVSVLTFLSSSGALGLNSGGELQESATYFDCCKVKHKNIFLL